jgi:hypothetical protein
MLKKLLIGSTFGLLLGVGTMCAEVIVKVEPPALVVEKERPVAPGPNHVWVAGYHRWDGHLYIWVPGRWDLPPHPGWRWIEPRWEKRPRGWAFVKGGWHRR